MLIRIIVKSDIRRFFLGNCGRNPSESDVNTTAQRMGSVENLF